MVTPNVSLDIYKSSATTNGVDYNLKERRGAVYPTSIISTDAGRISGVKSSFNEDEQQIYIERRDLKRQSFWGHFRLVCSKLHTTHTAKNLKDFCLGFVLSVISKLRLLTNFIKQQL